jgi:hypothetical protein
LSDIFSYAIANLAASVIVAKAKGWPHVKKLPLTFAILHFGYGIGFLDSSIHPDPLVYTGT